MRTTPIFTLSFKTDNAAFDEYLSDEIVRILRESADRIARSGLIEGSVQDRNGNTVGRYTWEG